MTAKRGKKATPRAAASAKKPRARRERRSAPAPAAPPARQPKPSAVPGPPPPLIAELAAEPSTDPLKAQAQLYSIVVASAFDAAKDEKLSPEDRRKEIRTIAAVAAKLIPRTRLWEAEQVIKRDREQLEQRAAQKRGAKLEKL